MAKNDRKKKGERDKKDGVMQRLDLFGNPIGQIDLERDCLKYGTRLMGSKTLGRNTIVVQPHQVESFLKAGYRESGYWLIPPPKPKKKRKTKEPTLFEACKRARRKEEAEPPKFAGEPLPEFGLFNNNKKKGTNKEGKRAGKTRTHKCPSGYCFGIDTDEFDECDDCPVWEDCCDKRKELGLDPRELFQSGPRKNEMILKLLLYRTSRKMPLAAIQRSLSRKQGHDVSKQEVHAALKAIGAAWVEQKDGSRRYYLE